MTRLDYLLKNLVAAVERRRRLEDIEGDTRADLALVEARLPDSEDEYDAILDDYFDAQVNRASADKSVLAIAADVADEWSKP